MKTKFDSYCINGIAKGCKYCVKGKKLVLFVTGVCTRNCWYCSLSKKRKNKNLIFANERECKNFDDILEEAKESKATSAGITGGDPLIFFDKTIEFAMKLKKTFGKKFHIHIYLPTKLVTKDKLEKLSKCVDEVRFHPEFLINSKKETEDFEKIKLASLFWKKENIGIELPMIPEKKKEILEFILKMEKFVSFVNLNEFELSETNFEIITKNYSLKEGGYVIRESLEAGKWILNELSKRKSKLKVHMCTAELKNCSQFANRLKRHTILPYGKKTKDGTVIYLIVNKKLNEKNTFYDEKKKRTILSEKIAKELIGKEKIIRVEEYPTYDRIEVECEEL
ncbi:4Fe-4S cluster-binding domain-containing protein [Candidatus Pacearchaeota archaeon]|jgi:hypothetical protein|nr:4Fe-4S cluster-binding domain-containing protein [Candidatus Pacearchaeota archaeon]